MVNTGRPSKGCFACRKRRVKCDEGKPQCQRCINLKRDCPGYIDSWSTVVRSQNDWAKTSVARRVEFKLKERELNDLQRQLPRSDDERFVLELYTPRIPPQFFIEPEIYAVNRFYADYVLTSGTLPFLNYLPDMYSDPSSDPCILEAVPAVALASSAKQLNRYDLMEKAHFRYGQTLKALAQVLQDENRARHDAALLTVFLLGLYEFITVDHLPEKDWDSHGAGRLALLRLRGKEQLDSPAGQGLFILIHHQMLVSSFLSGKAPASDFLDWIDGDLPWDVIFALESIIYTASKLCHQLTSMSTGKIKTTNDDLIDLVRTGLELDGKVELWNTELPNTWPDTARMMELVRAQDRFGSVMIGAGCETAVHQDETTIYSGITRAVTRAQYKTVRIHLLGAISQALPCVQDCPDLEKPALLQGCQDKIARLAEEICDDVPVVLGEADGNGNAIYPTVSGAALRGYSLLWPLRVASGAPGISEAKRRWIKDKLNYIGQALGLGRATAIAQAVHSAPPCLRIPSRDYEITV